jgi:hypothetical protein
MESMYIVETFGPPIANLKNSDLCDLSLAARLNQGRSGKLTFLNFFARKKFRFVALPELTPVCRLVSVLPKVDG